VFHHTDSVARPPPNGAFQNPIECERRLWTAVLLTAIKDLQNKKRRRSAMRWIAESDPSVGGFRWICDHLQLDHIAAREKILRTPASQIVKRVKLSRHGNVGGNGTKWKDEF
jgi:hypothetical protein